MGWAAKESMMLPHREEDLKKEYRCECKALIILLSSTFFEMKGGTIVIERTSLREVIRVELYISTSTNQILPILG